ncbi:sensor histidine kinase [Leptolyngbya sp. BC1307]|uniref:sensor histidine kinase n=1 Tax=Leptolyngbya sp. BC1307 TaxID=2029589 RepID=UPI000EFD8FA0|nr:sensor histidine kinase [Leptolyngbya sp. BC1307]
MKDPGQALLDKVDIIIDAWIKEVRRDIDIDSTQELTYIEIRDGLPGMLQAMATLLTPSPLDDQDQAFKDTALEHGTVRAQQGFDTAEIVREYRVLRNVILMVLEPELSSGTVKQALTAVRKIDHILDSAVLISLDSYIKHRFDTLEQMQGQLLLTNQELTRLVQSQKDNLSHLAHELKNPLNAMLGFSSILLRKQRKQLTPEAGSSMEIKQIERVISNGRQLLRLINNTLEASRQESQQIVLTMELVPVPDLVQAVIETLAPTAQLKALTLAANCDRAPQQITTDALRLQQVLTNLISNAIRYTDSGSVDVTCYEVEGGQWAIAVRDTGRGISPEQHAQIFEPYFRAGGEGSYAPESSGLGLTIVNKLVRLLQGRIELVSAVGEGSTFTVFLPVEMEGDTGDKIQKIGDRGQ